MKSTIVITDPGIDDMIALVLLHKLNSGNVCLIPTFGNATEQVSVQNVKECISFVSPSWQWMHGSSVPLNGHLEHPWPDYFHGPDGVWGVHPSVDISMMKPLHVFPNYTQVISLATVTDVNKLNAIHKIQQITLMGGAFTVKGNETEFAETNFAFDPDAAHVFFQQVSHGRVQVVPLDVTRKVTWTFDQVQAVPETNAINIWLKKLLVTWFKNYTHEREKQFCLHDPLAVYLSYFPDVAKWYTSGVRIVTKGKKRGASVFCKENYPCAIAFDLNDPQMISEHIYSLIFLGNQL